MAEYSQDDFQTAIDNPFTTLLLYGGKTAIDEHAGRNEANAPVDEGANENQIQSSSTGAKDPNTSRMSLDNPTFKRYAIYGGIAVGSIVGLKLLLNLVK